MEQPTEGPTLEHPWKITRHSYKTVKKTDPIAGEMIGKYIDDGCIVVVKDDNNAI